MKNKTTCEKPCCDLGATLGFLTLRVWLALRAIVTGIGKYAGTTTSDAPVVVDGNVATGLTETSTQKIYSLANYSGVPKSLYGSLQSEPLIPEFALKLFDACLGPALILLGVTLLLGIATRLSLFAMGLIYSFLTVGLILLRQDAGIAWLGIHVLLVAVALFHAKHNRLAFMRKL